MKIMDIIPDKYTESGTWEKDGILMCSKECCGSPVSECSCGPDCKYCNCHELNKMNETGYGMQRGVAMPVLTAVRSGHKPPVEMF